MNSSFKIEDGVVLFGAGQKCKVLLHFIQCCNMRIRALFDNDDDKIGKNIEGETVKDKKEIAKYNNYIWCITITDIKNRQELYSELINYGYHPSKEIMYNNLLLECCRHNYNFTSKVDSHVKRVVIDNSVLFDCTNGLGLGGIETRTIMLCEELIKKKNNNIYILSNSNNHEIEIPDLVENHIIKINSDNNLISEVDIVDNYIDILLEKLPCTVVTNWPDLLLLSAYFVKERFPDYLRIISIVAGLSPSIINNYISYGTNSELYIGVSKDIQEELVKQGINKDIITTMYVPFPCEERLRRSYSLDLSQPIIIGYAGRLDGLEKSQKRMDLILKLILGLKNSGIYFHFNIAGDGPIRALMEDYISNNYLLDYVSFWGVLSKKDMVDFWKKQDICINMADYEGRSISVVEAMGAGAVPIVTDTSGVRDDIIDGENGFIVPIGDYESASNRIEYLNYNRELLPKMGINAHNEVFPKSRMEDHVIFWERQLSDFAYCGG